MSRHVAPHRWADAALGRLTDDVVATMEAHASDCPRCARGRDSVASASGSFPAIRDEPAPELSWDTIRARVHWSSSSAARSGVQAAPRPRRRLAILVAGLAMSAAAASGWWLVHRPTSNRGAADVASSMAGPATTSASASVAEPLQGVVTLASGDFVVDGDAGLDAFGRRIGADSEVRTGKGNVTIQFDADSAFRVGPSSTVAITRFDSRDIELEVTGELDVTVSPRRAGQRFVVRAGNRTVEVRGTQFSVVRRGGQLDVRCHHGAVAVGEGRREAMVRGEQGLRLEDAQSTQAAAVRGLSESEVSELVATTPYRLPAWTVWRELSTLSAPLVIAASGAHGVRIDGLDLHSDVVAADVLVRVMSGRHIVETETTSGQWRNGGWIEVAHEPTRVDAGGVGAAAVPRDRPVTSRSVQLSRHRELLRQCARPLIKQGIDNTFAEFEVTVDGNGVVGAVNLIATDLPASAADCVRRTITAINFPDGDAMTWRQRIDL